MAKQAKEYKSPYNCPKCNKHSIGAGPDTTIVSRTKAIFTGDLEEFDYEPGYTWIETHRCGCGTKWKYTNGC